MVNMRARFEKWFREHTEHNGVFLHLIRNDDGEYMCADARIAWAAWEECYTQLDMRLDT